MFKLKGNNMKKVLLVLSILIGAGNAWAGTCEERLGMAFTPNQRIQLCKSFGSAVSQSLIPSADNTYDVGSSSLGWRTGYFDTSVITPLVNHATSLALGIGGTAEATVTNDALTFSGAAASIVGGATSITLGSAGSTIIDPANDPQRLITFASSSDTALTVKYGDSGTTATQGLTISASTADADDDSTSTICGGGAAGSSRGACAIAYGNETADQGTLDLQAGNAGGAIKLTVAGGTKFTVNATGELIGAGTATIGWALVSAANQACSTTCVTPCVMGQETTSKAFLACSDATADICLCAGAT